MRFGNRKLDRTVYFHVQSLLVKKTDRAALVEELSRKIIFSDHDIPEVEIPSEGFLGEYPWHPAFSHLQIWDEGARRNLSVAVQPPVATYSSGISSYDFSIDETFQVELPGPGLVRGLGLRLSDGKRMSYVDGSGRTLFFDPSVDEPGYSAALVDRDAFIEFLARGGLECVWIVGGLKRAAGGKSFEGTFGGERLYTSVFWLTDKGFRRRDRFEERKPSPEELRNFLAEESDDEIALPKAPSKGSRAAAVPIAERRKRMSGKAMLKPQTEGSYLKKTRKRLKKRGHPG